MTDPETLPAVGDRYNVHSLIGVGGMGRVYLAEDARHDRRVALKMLDSGLARIVGVERFLREVSIAAKLVHPNIVPLYDSGEVEGQLYYVMPYIEGQSLRHLLQQEIQLPLDKAVRWAVELADALAYAHSRGFIHRDIKPENVLIQADHAMIADFGIARAVDLAVAERVTNQGITIGTPAYMSPEQACGESRLDGRSDIYSLACVVYEMIVGEPPFGGATAKSITARKLAGQYSRLATARPSVPPTLERCLARALAPTAADRFPKAEDFAKALAATSRPAGRRIAIALVGSALLGAVVWQGLKSWSGGSAAPAGNRVVVGVFENRTGDHHYDRIGMMAADWVTDGLQRTGVLDVVPTATALAAAHFLRQRAEVDPVRALAEETDAKFVITGSVYLDGDSLVFRAQLNDGANGRVVGALAPIRAGDSNPNDGLGQLRARLMGLVALAVDERVGPTGVQSEQPPIFDAYQAFSEGMDAYIRSDYRSALIAFRRAHRLDSTFVLPLLYVALCHNNDRDYAAADSVFQELAQYRSRLSTLDRHWLDYSQAELRGDHVAALAAIRRAVLLAPSSKAAYNFAVEALQARQAFAAESALRRVSPDHGPMRGWVPYWEVLADALHAQGKYAAELQVAQAARIRFPHRTSPYILEMRALAALRRGADLERLLMEAERRANPTAGELGELALETASELRAHSDSARGYSFLERAERLYQRVGSAGSADAQWGRMRIATQKGSWSEAVTLGEQLTKQDPSRTSYQGALAVALARTGARARARAILDGLANDSQSYPVGFPQFEAARVAASLGETGEAVRLIEAAFAKGYSFNLGPHLDVALGPLRNHPLLGPSDGSRR